MTLFFQTIKDSFEDLKYSRAYKRWKAVRKELEMWKEVNEGITDINSDNLNFKRFVERRIAKFEYKKTLADVSIEKAMANWSE